MNNLRDGLLCSSILLYFSTMAMTTKAQVVVTAVCGFVCIMAYQLLDDEPQDKEEKT